MSDNYKNKLQEYCFKYKIPAPVYETIKIVDNFQSTVTINDISENSLGLHTKKINAEKEAAELLYHRIMGDICEKDSNHLGPGIYLCDLENIPIFFKPKNDQLFIGFLSNNHHSIKEYKNWVIGVDNLIVGQSYINLLPTNGLKDMVDHYISAFTYPISCWIINNSIDLPIYIVSRDKAAWCSKLCLENWLVGEDNIPSGSDRPSSDLDTGLQNYNVQVMTF